MAHDAVKHDYHLVNPSPWPLVGSIAATVMMIGAVIWMKGLFGLEKGTWWLFAAGLAGVIYTMIGWWRDVVKEANEGDHTPVVSIGLRYGMILFIASEVMFFVAWFWIFFEMALFHEHRTLASIEEVRSAWATWPRRRSASISRIRRSTLALAAVSARFTEVSVLPSPGTEEVMATVFIGRTSRIRSSR